MSLKRSHTSTRATPSGGSDGKLGRQELFDELKKHAQTGQVFTPVDISMAIGASEAAVSRTLLGLAAEGYLEKVEVGKYRSTPFQEVPQAEFLKALARASKTDSTRQRDLSEIARLKQELDAFLAALAGRDLQPEIVSGGSTPTLFHSHLVPRQTEIRPGTYIFNDRTTAAIGACEWQDCAYSVLATVVSTAVPGQAVVDAGSKSLNREDIRGAVDAPGFGALLDRPEVFVKGLSEEHGLLDLSATDWRPEVGERVRIVPNHVCISVNLQPRVHGVRADLVERSWEVAARGWD